MPRVSRKWGIKTLFPISLTSCNSGEFSCLFDETWGRCREKQILERKWATIRLLQNLILELVGQACLHRLVLSKNRCPCWRACSSLGLFGMLLSMRVTEGGKFLYSTLFGYGIASFCFHWNLWEGFYRVLDVQLNFLQAINIVYMSCIPKGENLFYKVSSYLLIMFFSIYPFFAHVLGITLKKSWISWITFDGIWIFVLIGLMIIWFQRDHLGPPEHPSRQAMFNLVWKTIFSVMLAYLFWILDEVVCVLFDNHRFVIVIFGHTLWHVFIGFGFYYMTTLIVFLRAADLGVYPKVLTWPKNKPFFVFVVVQYEPRDLMSKAETTPKKEH